MQLTTRGRYAVMALVHLAGREDGCTRPITLAEIAGAQRLSLPYLEQLFGRLRRAGIVTSVRGPGGGYRLARACEEVSIGCIVDAVEEPLQATRCSHEDGGCIQAEDGSFQRCRTHDLWHELSRQIGLFLSGVTLRDVLQGHVAGRAVLPLCASDTAPSPKPQAAE